MKEPQVKDWCHFIEQRVCFHLPLLGCDPWAEMISARETLLEVTS